MNPECERILAWMSESLDGQAPPEVEREFRDHLAACPSCRVQVGLQMQAEHLLKTSLPVLEPGPALWTRLADAVALPRPSLRTLRRWALGLAAALACLMVLAALPIVRGIGRMEAMHRAWQTRTFQAEMEGYLTGRSAVIASGNPFTAPGTEARSQDEQNPFSPFTRAGARNPFAEIN
ncbi:MAG: zf-HC2 domain-containing protein [Acidobacteria bacterium]|nr:zf-HC2 domain-containing protein [Acidobacteriota bacterium]